MSDSYLNGTAYMTECMDVAERCGGTVEVRCDAQVCVSGYGSTAMQYVYRVFVTVPTDSDYVPLARGKQAEEPPQILRAIKLRA